MQKMQVKSFFNLNNTFVLLTILFSCQYNLLMTKRFFYFYQTLIKSTVNGDLGLNGLLAQKHAEEERNLAQGK